MVSMHQIDKSFDTGPITDKVKHKPMHEVFKKGPENDRPKEYARNTPNGKPGLKMAVVEHKADNGKVHAPDDEGVGFGQQFQVLILK